MPSHRPVRPLVAQRIMSLRVRATFITAAAIFGLLCPNGAAADGICPEVQVEFGLARNDPSASPTRFVQIAQNFAACRRNLAEQRDLSSDDAVEIYARMIE